MSAIESLLAKPMFQALGWTLLHFIWQGAAIAILYAAARFFLGKRAANARYFAACLALALMLAAPLVTLFVMSRASAGGQTEAFASEPTGAIETSPVVAYTAKAQPKASMTAAPQSTSGLSPSQEPASFKQWAQERFPTYLPWMVALWFAGVLFFSLRFLGGLIVAGRIRRRETSALVGQWQERLLSLAKQLRISRPVRLCESILVEVPTVIGWLRPVILVPASALTGLSAEQIEALLAHELAHIRRHDYLINLVQTAIETLLFYHPAVWWISGQIREEREHCCDDLAVAACGSVLVYARALAELEQLRSRAPQLAMAASGGSLLRRIQRLIGRPSHASHRFESGLAGVIALATVLSVLAGANTPLLSKSATVEASVSTLTSSETRGDFYSDESESAQVVDQKPLHKLESASAESDAQESENLPADMAEVIAPEGDAATGREQNADPGSPQDFLGEMRALGYTDVDDLIALKTHGVNSEFVREMNGLLNKKLSADQLAAFRIHGVTTQFVGELKALGYTTLSAEELIAFRIHGVTSQFVSDWKSLGYDKLTPGELVAFRIHGVSAALVQKFKELGYDRPDAGELTALRIHGVTPEFVQAMRGFIRGDLSIDQLTGLRIHGVTPEFVKEMNGLGYTNLSADQLMGVRIHGLTSKFVADVKALGFKPTVDEFMQLRIHGVTPEFIEAVKSRGFNDVTISQLIELRRLNIMPGSRKK
jgi:beta-lactamase regulating signal transducer with metallopeptidase domain